MKVTLLIALTCFCLLLNACVGTKNLTSKAENIKSYSYTLSGSNASVSRPPESDWKAQHKAFLDIITDYRTDNNKFRKSTRTTSTIFIVGSAIVGLIGGIYGLAADNSSKGAGVTSLVAGAVSGLQGTLGVQKKLEKCSECSALIEEIRLKFNPMTYPRNDNEYLDYVRMRDESVKKINDLKCYGFQQ